MADLRLVWDDTEALPPIATSMPDIWRPALVALPNVRHAGARHDAFCDRDAAAESPCAPGRPNSHAIADPPHFPAADGQSDAAADSHPSPAVHRNAPHRPHPYLADLEQLRAGDPRHDS